MTSSTYRAARYARAWLTTPSGVVEEEIVLSRGDVGIPTTLAHPPGRARPLPAWVVLHGITRPGRAHGQLVRFTRALVSTGAVAIVPDVPEWRDLSLAPDVALPTIRAAIAALEETAWARDAPVGVVGFSFGAPHAVCATTSPSLGGAVAGCVAFGGYCSLRRTVRFLMTGEHEWSGRRYALEADAYGRWIVAANYLTAVPGFASAGDVARALRELAEWAGDTGLPSLDPRLEPRRAELRAGVAEERQALFDLFAPAGGRLAPGTRVSEMAEALSAAAAELDPGIEPASSLARVDRPVHVLHGRYDSLIPFSEGLRLHEALPRAARPRATVTRLFGHSGEASRPALARIAWDLPQLFVALRRVLSLV